MAERDVVDVDQHFLAALAVPHLPPGVARVAHDGADGGLRPRDAVAVAVACRIMRRRARDAVACEALGDGVQALAGDVLAEDALHHRRGDRGGFQAVAALAGGGLARVGVRAEIDQAVAVGWAATEKATFGRGLGGHGRADADLDAVALPFRHTAVE